MSQFRMIHRHAPEECGASLAAWQGFPSPLRGAEVTSSCSYGHHVVWWDVEAADAEEALSWLPAYVATRTDVERTNALAIP